MNMNILLWLIPVVFTIHNVEEFLTMRKYGSEHFKKMKPGQFPAAIALLTLMVIIFIYLGTDEEFGIAGRFLAIFGQASLFINALFHIVATLRLRRYTPGFITALLIYIPFSVYFFDVVLQSGYISGTNLLFDFLAAIIMQAPLIIGSLWLGGKLVRVFVPKNGSGR